MRAADLSDRKDKDVTTTQTMSAAEPLTEENERELLLLARRYEAVARLLRQRDDLRKVEVAARSAMFDRPSAPGRDELRALLAGGE